ncbi:hypothetical protein BH11ACT5_BH11ACT5_15650 [soil metagenome]
MPHLIAAIALALAGIAAVVGGIITWRTAKKLVVDARQTLLAMFGDSFPGLFTEEPDPRGARIAAVGFVGVGVALLVVAAVQLYS